ncbi:Hypothetical predicted protein [Olea europaea subsp. europaea]|uniref:Uncharacterized protein n=1 Tax=Olea europaea subsp. europaea TaxID=158383 RepID=A0A8S0Q9F5_OLEEU|nr:Hypothetical predicted protein [Olea europaea subsp. europaea]
MSLFHNCMKILLDLKIGIVEASAASYSSPAQLLPWYLPMRYHFRGLATVLGLIGFALLGLACSYWKHFSYLENQGKIERDLKAGEVNDKLLANFEEMYLVIMAGQEK